MMQSLTEHPWAADEFHGQQEVGLESVGLESVATPGSHAENAPAPYYAELVEMRGGRRMIFRAFFHDFKQLGLHPRSQARLEGLVKRGGHLFIDPDGEQPICGLIKGRLADYPRLNADDEQHCCIVLDADYTPAPRDNIDAFARQKKIRAFLV
ncbi:MAG: hypothetical protein ACE366_30485 [Bradymonadia bacterium]